MTIPQALQLALQHHQAGRLADAEALYRQILAADPRHADALHLIGVLAHQSGRHELAVELIARAIEANPSHAGAYGNLGLALSAQRRFLEAVAAFRQATALDPQLAAAHYGLGDALSAQGLFGESITAYRQGLALAPAHAAALNNLGNALRAHGQPEEAAAIFRQALEQMPESAEMHYNLGNALKDLERWSEAESAYRRSLELKPGFAEAHNNLGSAAAQDGRFDEAIAAFEQVLRLNPNHASAHNNLGNALKAQGRLEESVTTFQRAIEIKPDYDEAHFNLGNTLQELERSEEAVASFQRALQTKPDYPEAENNLGAAFAALGRMDEALAAYQRSLKLRHDSAETYHNIGNALLALGQVHEAIASFRSAIQLKPDFAEAYGNLANALRDAGDSDVALAMYSRSLELEPDSADTYNNMGNALKDRGQLEAALAAYRRSMEFNPDEVGAHTNLVYTLLFQPRADDRLLIEERARWNARFAEALREFRRPHANKRSPDRRLRIGYVSPNFRRHVIGANLLPLFRHHDHSVFEIFCYHGSVRSDAWTQEFRNCADHWRSTVGVSDETLAEIIRRDGIDVLVDLTQHMAENRLLLFAHQPAPVQVSFAGYPETTGMAAIPYRLNDRYLHLPSATGYPSSALLASPEGCRTVAGDNIPGLTPLHGCTPEGVPESPPSARALSRSSPCERVFLLDSFWCYDPGEDQVPVGEFPAKENGHVTFGSLNNFCKVNEPMLKLWARILAEVKNSRLILLSPRGSHRKDTQEFFSGEGIEPEHIEFANPRPHREYLEIYRKLDIVLDPFPYNGHTTSLDALWMGVPVVSLAGETAVSRAGLSQLSNLGLPDLIAFTEDDYLCIATQLAYDLPRLSELRANLRPRMEKSVLMNAPHFARQIECAYRTMWRDWCAMQQG